jgi:hypothetical protein
MPTGTGYNRDMKRVKLTGLEEVKKLIEEGQIFIRDDAKRYLEEMSSYTWDPGPDSDRCEEETSRDSGFTWGELPPLPTFTAGEDIEEGSPVYARTGDGRVYKSSNFYKDDSPTWTETFYQDYEPEKIDPKSALLEAKAGKDGVFRVIEESPPHDEDLEEAIRKFRDGMKEETERITRKIWGIDFAE